MAECMGLNRDGSKAYNLSPLETHVRRLIWHQLCFLDIRTCEAQGPKPAIRREDYDTWLPDNCEEDQLTASATCQARPSEGWTSALFPLIRFEINEMMRIIWADRRKLEARKITPTQVLTKVENFRRRMLEHYDRLLDGRAPVQRYAKLVMHLLLYRLHVMVLHPYYANTASPMPQRLRSVLIASATMVVELAAQLDADPAFRPWRWYGGAYQQYQAALILATEMFYHPNHKDPGRIWACLDFVFGLDGSMPAEEKGRQILGEIMEKMGMYMSMRKTRAPTLTATASPARQAVKAEEAGGSRGSKSAGAAARAVVSPGQQQPHPGSSYPHAGNARPPLKEEPDTISPTGTHSGSFRGSSYSAPGTGIPTAISPQHHQHHHLMAGAGPSSVFPASSQHSTPVPNLMAAGGPSGEAVWGMAPLPLNPDSPENSSSDGGSVMGTGGVAGMANLPLVAGGSGSGQSATAGQVLDGGDWVSTDRFLRPALLSLLSGSLSFFFRAHSAADAVQNYQEDAINALFPYDPHTGGFAGFGDPMTTGFNGNNNGWTQQHMNRTT